MKAEWFGKCAVITGGASGIGLALAKALVGQGARVVLASRDSAKLERAADLLRQHHGEVLIVRCDVADRPQVYELAERAEAAFGQVDLLCANAGATSAGRYVDHGDEDWDWTINVNLRGATNCVQAFYPAMVRHGSGTIMLTGSQTSLPPDWIRNHGPYVPAKAAVLALAMSLREEAAELGVKVSLLLPAGADTDIISTTTQVPPDSAVTMFPNGHIPEPLPGFPLFLSPDEVAARALAGLRNDAPIIVTHAAMKPQIEDYFSRILAAYDDAACWEL